jgi:undecaprenyl-diphosphatase
MQEIFHSVVLGIVQGLAEFLPISSSAHLIIIPYLFNWPNQGLIFDVALHFGTAFAVVAYFWRDWLKIIRSAFVKTEEHDYPKNFLWQILVASIPAMIVGKLLSDFIDNYFHSANHELFAILTTVIDLAIFGAILWAVDAKSKQSEAISKITFRQSFTIGLAQCLALIPGVSRSGVTMLAARGIGFKRSDAAKVSFLLGAPATVGAFLLEVKKITPEMLTPAFFLGVTASAIAGILAIKYLLAYLQKSDFKLFSFYRFAVAIIVILVVLLRL